MIESFVDLTYRGLPLGRRVKLTEVRPSTGYLEVPLPMPVGAAIAILTDDTVALEATVVEVHEQVTGIERVAGMVVRPKLEGDAAKTWWKARVALPELDPKPTAVPRPPIVAVAPKRLHPETAVPELMDDGQDTSVMDAVDPALVVDTPPRRDSNPDLVDDGKRTTAMDAVDLAALGLDPSSSGQIPAARTVTKQMPGVAMPVAPDDDDDDANDNDKKLPGTQKKKKKRR
jgi:hypothetical protein